MSGQYPPPNPPHPFGRAAHHQRAPTLPPWGLHSPQPTGVGGTMNFYGSPHMGLPNRGAAQPWSQLQQARPKPLDTRPLAANPLYGLQMMREPESGQRRAAPEYTQEESMDLSSHANASVIATGDTLRNGTEVNGELVRTEDQVKESIVTSVIAPNPLREAVSVSDSPALNYSKAIDSSVVRRVESPGIPEDLVTSLDSPSNLQSSACVKSYSSELDSSLSGSVGGFENSGLKTASNSVAPVLPKDNLDSNITFKDSRFEQPNFHSSVSNTSVQRVSEYSMKDDSFSAGTVNFDNRLFKVGTTSLNVSQSFTDNSMSVDDTDDSKLVVAESSTDDIFGLSPNPSAPTSQETKSSETSEQLLTSQETVPENTSEATPVSSELGEPAPTVAAAEPHPSVENVETLLESMFNSQEDASCSSQTSNSSVPQSVIVSNGAKMPVEFSKPYVEMSTPLKKEELARTLEEDSPIETKVKEENKEETLKDDLMDEIEKKLELLTESGSIDHPQPVTQPKSEPSLSLERDSECVKTIESTLMSSDEKAATDTTLTASSSLNVENKILASKTEVLSLKSEFDAVSTSKAMIGSQIKPEPVALASQSEVATGSEAGTSSNPFIEVETELEKMFAGIVEPAEEVNSDNTLQPSVSESKKSVVNKRPVAKRKKANSRRASDISLFGGSSGETTPVKKKGRKRVNESGSDRGPKKMKLDGSDTLKKGRLPKDVNSDKVKGPFVHIEGSKESPASVVVVNSGVRADDDDGTDKNNARRKLAKAQRSEWVTRKSGPVYSSSAMSARYNSDKADLSWVCVFCKRGPHCVDGLGGEPAGDLFGPYRVPAMPPHDDLLPPGQVSDHDLSEEQKRRGGGKLPKSIRSSGGADQFVQKMAKKSKRSVSTDSLEPQGGVLAVEGGYEVWMHGPCAEWAPGLTLIGTQLVGLDDAVWTGLKTRCTHCGESGAGISCVVRSCPTRMHYPCAVVSGWLLDTDTFIARCHVHRTRLRPS